MERLQRPCYIGEHLDVNLLQECCSSLGQGFVSTQQDQEGDHQELGDYYYNNYSSSSSSSHLSSANNNSLLVEDSHNKMPFIQMLQSVELPPFLPLKEPTFQALLKLQNIKRPCWGNIGFSPSSINTDVLEAETVVSTTTTTTQDNIADPLQCSSSPVKSEIFDIQNPPPSIRPSLSQDQAPNLLQDTRHHQSVVTKPSPPGSNPRERRKRKRTRPTKNKEEVESQRMTHIAVERNRRRLMNEHLSSLRALMPPSYVQRGDQASIVGGAIDFVKELEQLLQSLEAQKRIRRTEEAAASNPNPTPTATPFFTTHGAVSHFCPVNSQMPVNGTEQGGGGVQVRQRSEVAEVEVTVIQNHVNLKVHCQRRPGQLLRAVVALEDLKLTVLHLNITSSYTTVLYTFNLKMEEECKLGSAGEVAGAVHQIFSIINGS